MIRKAEIGDLDAIRELNYKLFDLEFHNFNPALNMKWTYSEKGEKYFKDVIEKGTVWVAVDNQKVIGYLAGIICGRSSYKINTLAEIDNIFVDEKYRGKGIGKKLVSEFKKYCINNKIEEIKVTTNALNTNARGFYENNGFKDFEATYKMKL